MDHIGHEHAHDHAHGGGHDHARSDEMLEQLLTVGICGAFGTVAILLGWQAISTGKGMLEIILIPEFWPWVLGGGIVLLLFSIIRGIALWKQSGHEHGTDCGHDHSQDGHEHGGVFWRAVVLMFPLMLFFLGVPNQGFSSERMKKLTQHDIDVTGSMDNTVKDQGNFPVTFTEISDSMRDPALMKEMNGMRATVQGKLLKKENGRECTLYTEKMTCCAADMVPLRARILVESDETGGTLQEFVERDPHEVSGILQFVKIPNSEQYLPVIRAKHRDIKALPK